MSARERLESACAAAIDRSVLYVMEQAWLVGAKLLGERVLDDPIPAMGIYATDALKGDPRAFFPEPEPARVERKRIGSMRGGSVERWTWPSRYRTWEPGYQSEYDRYEANATCDALALTHAGVASPTVICVPTWLAGRSWLSRALPVRELYRIGFDVVLFTLPFHGARTPAQARFGGQLFPSGSARRTNEGFGQLVWDVRSLVGYLEERSPSVGVLGMSLGGYSAALVASVEPRLGFVVPIMPVVDIAELMWTHGATRPEGLAAATRGATLAQMRSVYAVHCPLTHRPEVAHDRRMIVAGRGDAICAPSHVLSLWEHWERPRIHFWTGGHVAHFGRSRAFQAIAEFLETIAR